MRNQAHSVERMKEPYVLAKRHDWEGFREFFLKNKDLLDKRIDLRQSTPFHCAAHCVNPSMCEEMLEMVEDPSNIQRVLRMQDVKGKTPLHEVAFVGEVKMTASILKYEFKETEERETRQFEPLLFMRNHLGETPVYRAAALGKTPLLKYFVDGLKIDLRQHFHRTVDGISILHMAVIGQFFGLLLRS